MNKNLITEFTIQYSIYKEVCTTREQTQTTYNEMLINSCINPTLAHTSTSYNQQVRGN